MDKIRNIFWWTALLHVLASLLGLLELVAMTRPFIMITLAYFTWYQLEDHQPLGATLVSGMLLCWFGDIAGAFRGIEALQVFGLLAFGGSLVIYSWIFLSLPTFKAGNQHRLAGLGSDKHQLIRFVLRQRFYFVGFLLVVGLALSLVYGPYLKFQAESGTLFALSLFVLLSLSLAFSVFLSMAWTPPQSYLWSGVGAMLLLASVTLVALSRLDVRWQFTDFLVSLSYIGGQWSIGKGLRKQVLSV